MEMLDIYDANKKHIGIADRNVAHTFGLWHKTVHCWIVWDGKLVFQRRSRNLDNNAGKLYTTASGHVSAGETIDVAFGREISQEIGITPRSSNKISETTWVADMKKSNGAQIIDRVFANVFWAEYDGKLSDFRFTDGEVDSVVAIDLDSLIRFIENGGDLTGTEWDGKSIKTVNLTENDFVINEGETMFGKYGFNALHIKRQL
jgi:adhesin HecA-like repeat protein